MADVAIVNLIPVTSASTDLTAFNYTDDPLIDNYVARSANEGDTSDVAVPYGLQLLYSLNYNGVDQHVEGDLDPLDEDLIVGDNYTFCAWVKFNNLAAFPGVGLYQDFINCRHVGGPTFEPADAVAATAGFTLGILEDTGDYRWTLNINGTFDSAAAGTIVAGDWYYIVIHKVGADASLYVSDGVLDTGTEEVVTLAGLNTLAINSNIRFGLGQSSTYFAMQTCNTQLWGIALGASAIEDNQYVIQIPPQAEPAGLLYYYRMSPEFNETLVDNNYGRMSAVHKNFTGNPYIVDSPGDFGNAALYCLDYPGVNQHIIIYDNANDGAGTPFSPQKPGMFNNLLNSYVFEGWFKMDVVPGNGDDPVGLLSKWEATAIPANDLGVKVTVEWSPGLTKTVLIFRTETGDPGDSYEYEFDNPAGIVAGVWYHFAVVKDKSGTVTPSDGIRYHFFFHKDGTLVEDITNDVSGLLTVFGTDTQVTDVNLIFGAEHFYSGTLQVGHYLNGKTKSFRAFKTYRTLSQIANARNIDI
jgi:hypothetical protein